MRIRLEENKGIPASLLWMLAIISGVAVANLYYNQPLLNRMGEDLHVSEFTANLIPMVTQIGYALGLLFIIPLGDLYKRRNIIVINFSLLACSMMGNQLKEADNSLTLQIRGDGPAGLLHAGCGCGARYPLHTGGFAGDGCLFRHAADLHTDGFAVLAAAEQGP